METPVLTQKQKNQALSANKPKAKKRPLVNIRVILGWTTPATCRLLASKTTELLSISLRSVLSNVVPARVQWADLKNIPKDERKQFRNKQQTSDENSTSNIIFGINATTRAIERRTVCLVLIAHDINPIVMVKHVIESCNINDIPIWSVENLRELIKSCVGYPSIAIAFKDVAAFEILRNIVESFSRTKYDQFETNNAEELDTDDSVKLVKEEIIHRDVYLYRETTKTRSFKPKISNPAVDQETNYIQFVPSNLNALEPIQSRNKITDAKYRNIDVKEAAQVWSSNSKKAYKALKLKRLKPNANRIKKTKNRINKIK